MSNTIVVGCDIGGSHISTALVNLETKSLLEETFERHTVNSHDTVPAIITAWAACIKASLEKGGFDQLPVGIAIPGPFDYEKGISLMKGQNKYEALYEINVRDLLAEELAMDPSAIKFINDAASFLQGEMFAGAGTAFKRAVGLTLGTGLGSALFLNGHAEDGDLWCAPFREGIAEDYLAGRWLKDTYCLRSGQHVESVKALCELVPADQVANDVFREFGETLGVFVTDYLLSKSPEGLVLGGNISKAHRLFLEHTHRLLASKGYSLPIEIAALGEMAAIYGAAGELK
ncbi:ROK family protein [Olivibacter sp. XZL3]|uniref:ROK family protein n=1 Tax=Olivibacter sp. XZL3 TaxID=1735116 RepID=UPI001066FAEF|nr:ROK family protein [Olivibacter sp. XZL3]